jgi:transcriptional regulator with XRE-family HTH domain
MGELLHVSGRTVRRWEKGELMPTMDDVINICKEFNISLDEVFKGEMDQNLEIDRKLTQVNAGIESVNDLLDSADQRIKDMNREINSLKEQIRLMNNDEQYKKSVDNLTWLWLLLAHVIATTIGFICYVKGKRNYITTFVSTILYISAISYLMYKNRNNHKYLKMLLVYSVILGLNMFINIVLETNILQERELISGKPGVIRIDNIELLLVNGALYGLRHLGMQKIKLFIGLCFCIYSVWIIYCGYCLSSESVKPVIKKTISRIKKLSNN